MKIFPHFPPAGVWAVSGSQGRAHAAAGHVSRRHVMADVESGHVRQHVVTL